MRFAIGAIAAILLLHLLEQLERALHIELDEDTREVGLYGVDGDVKFPRDLLVAEPPGSGSHNLALPIAQLDWIAHTVYRYGKDTTDINVR